MNKEELINLRNDLMKKRQTKYVPVIVLGVSPEEPHQISVEECRFSSNNILLNQYKAGETEKKVILLLEERLKEIIEKQTLTGLDFNSIMVKIGYDFFVTEKLLNHCKYGYIYDSEFDKNEVLNPFVSISLNTFEFQTNGRVIREHDDNSAVVNYNLFASMLSEEGFSLNFNTFDELLNNGIKDHESLTTTINFNKHITK